MGLDVRELRLSVSFAMLLEYAYRLLSLAVQSSHFLLTSWFRT